MPETITDKDAHYAYDLVRAICTDVGPGVPGSSQERERAAIIEKELESHLGAGNVSVEDFALAPDAFLGALPMGALFTLIAALLNISTGRFTGISPWLTAMAALAFSILSMVPFVLEYVLYFEFIDPLFKKRQSVNVIGTLRRPEPQTRSACSFSVATMTALRKTHGFVSWVTDSMSPERPCRSDPSPCSR
jgi:hypothetical protein